MEGPPENDEAPSASGKGKAKGKAPTKSADTKGGKKGAGKGKGAPTLSKPPIAPAKAMKPLWWKRLLFGTDLQPGAIWDRVRDETASLPVELLERRFGKAAVSTPKGTAVSAGTADVIRIRTDAVQDRELRLLPSPADCSRALLELEDQRLALDELERLQRASPTKKELELLAEARKLQPSARLGRREEYWDQLAQIPSFAERMECWHFIRTYRERVSCQSQHLEDLSDVFESLENSEAVPALLALILATGNWMNRGTEFADAPGFDIEVLERLHSIKGADGRSLQHLLFMVFFDSLNSQAAEFVEALGPLLQNVSRRVVQDAEEAKISKAVHLTLEECDEAVSSIHEAALDIQATLRKCTEDLDPADPVKLRLHREFAAAAKLIESLVQLRNVVKSRYDRVLQWLQVSECRSADFFLLWDNFLLPGDLLAARLRDAQPATPRERTLDVEAIFCQDEAFGLAELQELWQLEELGRDLAEEGDPPFQRQLSRSPANAEDEALASPSSPAPTGFTCAGRGDVRDVRFAPLQWRTLALDSNSQTVWSRAEGQLVPIPTLELETKFSADAIADADRKRLAREASRRNEETAQASAARWAVLAQQLPRQEDVVHLLQDLDPASDRAQCTVQQLGKVLELLQHQVEVKEGPEFVFRRALGSVPDCKERLLFTLAMMTYRQKATTCMEGLEDFLDVVECFLHSKALPDYLSLILATGNYLNGGTPRGQADGFDLSELEKLTGIQDTEGKDLRQFVLQVFCQQMPVQAEQLFAELRPCFLNVRRSISKDALGTAKLSKTVLQAIEALDEEVSALQVSLKQAEEAVQTVLASQTSPAVQESLAQKLAEASAFVDDTVAFRDDVKAKFQDLAHFLHMKPMRSDDFCLLWDDLFVPGELMVNKGQDHYFIPAFCSDEPFALEHIKVLWQLQAEDANSLEDAEDDAVLREGPLDAEQFCRALVPSVQCPEDFANVARSYSACPGTRADGGDLGEVERGQMHSAIEAALFDPELELGCPLGPIQTDAGFHLLMARKKSRGILSTTVSASHILVKPGRYQAPSCEVHMHLPNMVGEEADMTRTWRRWSFAHSLPPALSHLAEAQDEAEQLQLKRQALRGKPGLRLLFRWEGAFIFNVKGILSDIAGDMIGPIHLVDGSLGTEEARYLGELLTSDDARTTKTDKDGFDARMDWAETGWQESEGILDADSMCTVQILLRRVGETLEHARKRMSTVRLRIKPTRLAYVASEPGLRLGLSSPSSVQDRLATLVSLIDSGELLVKVDGGEEEILDPRPSTVVVASTVERPAGCPVLLLYDEENLVQAEVLAYMGRHLGSRHRVRYQSGGVPEELEVDLNEMNHSLLRFASLREFEEARIAYCKQVVEDGRYIEDAITGNRVDISEQIVRVQMEVRKLPDPDSIRHMAFDDLEWISDTSFHLGDRVWAQGREGTVEHLQKHGRYVVKFADGTSSPALPASSIKRARPISGVQNSLFEQVRDISEMIPLLLHPSRVVQGRSHGAHSAQPVLIRAGPGTGKTWSMQQLLLLLAQELAGGEPGTSNAVKFRFVPLLIPIQKLARMLRTRPAGMEGETSSNLVLFFIRAEYPEGPTRNMLEQAFEMRSLIVMLDGIDEAANMKLAVEEFVTKTLVLMGVPLLVTSRPEGIRKRLYSRDFVIMNLQPLSGEQQQKIIEKQLQQNAFFKHLVAFSRARQAQEEAFRQSFPSLAEREVVQQLPSSLEEVPPATEDIDHEVFAAVFFCLAVRLLASAQLDPSCLQLPQETDQLPTQDVQKRLSIHSKKLGMIKADFVCPTAASMKRLSHSLLAGFTAPVDGEPANLQVVRCCSFFQDPGPTRLRFLRYELRLRYQRASLTAQVQIHHSACLSSFRTMKMQDHFTYLRRNLQSEGACDDMLEARMLVFDDICRVPVLLSVLACAFAVDTQRLPENLFDLYVMGMLSTLERRVGKDRVQVTLEMLQAIAVANHTAKRRTFQAEDLRTALKEPGHLALWSQLLEEGSVPLVKILTLGHMTGEFQFSHLSFQEALFVRALACSTGPSSKPFWSFWGSDASLNSSFNDPFYRNTFVIGRGYVGEALASTRSSFNFDSQPRLTALGREGLGHFLAGIRSLRRLNLGNVNLGRDVVVAPGFPQLRELVLSRCRLSKVQPLGALIKACPLRLLDLEGNPQLLRTSNDVMELHQTVGGNGLGELEIFSVRWCHIPPAAGRCVRDFLKACCPKLTHVDVQGNRGLPRGLFADAFPASCIHGC